MTPTMYSPDGRIYQVEYAIETVKRGTLAIGISTKQGVIMAVEEKPRTSQASLTCLVAFANGSDFTIITIKMVFRLYKFGSKREIENF